MDCSIVVPVFNGEGTLLELVERLNNMLGSLGEKTELILVNDGSADRSWELITELAGRFAWVRGINLMRNYGQHNATLCGIRAARYEVIVTMDDDLQHLPEQIPLLLETLNQGFDMVYGEPKNHSQSWWRQLGSFITRRLVASAAGVKDLRAVSPFRAFRTHLRNAFEDYANPDVMVDVLLSWGTRRIGVVAVDFQPRRDGSSNYTFRHLLRLSLLYLTNFSTTPLRISNLVGFSFTLLGLLGFVYVLVIYFTAGSIPGFPFLASAIMIFSGVQLFALGIIGEYLARVSERTAGRKPYTVSYTTPELPANP